MRSSVKISASRAGLAAAVLGALAIASLSSCDNSYPIYGSIQQEKPGATAGPFYMASVGRALAFNGDYFVHRANVAASADGSSWNLVSVGSVGTGYFCTGLAATSTALYAVINSQVPDKGLGLYSSANGSTWTLALADPTSNQTSSPMIDNVFVANNAVFVELHNENGTTGTSTAGSTDDTYTLSASFDGSTFSPVVFGNGGASSSTMPFLGAAYADGAYWIIAKDGLYASAAFSSTSPSGSFSQVTESGAPPTGAAIDCIMASTSTPSTLYLGTQAGAVYKRTTGGSGIGSGQWSNVGSLTYAVTALAEVPVSPTATAILAGLGANSSTTASLSISYGYIQLDPASLGVTSGGASAIVPNSTNYDTTLSGKPVTSFFYDPVGKMLFASTDSANLAGASGLWTTTWNGSSWSSNGWSPVN